ncbi:MAG: S8 family serine peptidase, partial [Magnetococcales bacterium]|nr:S8 family serine peptidase [Magnetococcales bacterium]
MGLVNFLILAIVLLIGSSETFAESTKLDAELGARLKQFQSAQKSPLARSTEGKDTLIAATVQFSGNGLAALRTLGVQIRSVLGDVATVLIPLNQLEKVAALPEVLHLEMPTRPVARLNKSVTNTKADQLRTGSLAAGWGGKTGKNVLVGIIDTGIDISHGDFLDANGQSRIVRLWNMRNDTGGTPPKGSDGTTSLYGAECDTAAINAVLTTTASKTSACNPDDPDNHGTHVAGIAAGNGGGTGNGQTVGRFVGMAPEAGLLVANAIDKSVNVPNGGDAVLDAISWMTRVATALGKPLVINLSLGSYYGNRDGTGSFQKAIDNTSAAGVVIVAAAGNEGRAAIRAEISPMTKDQVVAVTFNIPAGKSAEKLEFWSNGDNQYAVQVVCPDNTTTDYILAGGTLTNFNNAGCGSIAISSAAPSTTNGDRQYVIDLGKGSLNEIATGGWKLNVRADTLLVANETIGIISGEQEGGAEFTGTFKPTVTKGILTDSSSARRAISVAALNTNYVWNTKSGQTDKNLDNGPLGDVGNFSSRGPRRVCSANTKYVDVNTAAGKKNYDECTKPVMKPDITAPGSYIMSSLAKAATAAATPADIEADGVHVAYMGTSMATPHVAGAVALMLQSDATLTPEKVKSTLFTTLQSNQYSLAAKLPTFTSGVDMPTSPNDAWGYGLMDAKAAVSGSVDGSCGSSNSQSFTTAPTTNLCATGTASTLTGSGPWSWSCAGVSGGATSSDCSAKVTAGITSGSLVNGVTSTSHTASVSSTNSTLDFSWTAATSSTTGSTITYEYVVSTDTSLDAATFETRLATAETTSLKRGTLTNSTTATATSLADGSYYFFIRAMDAGGVTVGTGITKSGPYILNSAPTLDSTTPISPTSGAHQSAITVTINGTNFMNGATLQLVNGKRTSGGTTVTLSDVSLTNVTWKSASQLTATVPASTPPGLYDVKVTNAAPWSKTASATGKYTSSNTAPTAATGGNQTVSLSSGQASVSLSGATSSDTDSDTLSTYTWTLTSMPTSAIITSGASTLTTNSTLTGSTQTVVVKTAGNYTFSLVVNDGFENSSASTMTLTVNASAGSNNAPTADPGSDVTAVPGTAVTLSGSKSSDPDGNTLTSYIWTLTSKPTASSLTTGTAGTASSAITQSSPPAASFTPDVKGTYVVTLVVNDGTVASEAKSVTVTANNAPVANAGSTQTMAVGDVVTLDGTTSVDSDKDTLTYAWTQTSPTSPVVTLSSATTSKPTFTPSAAGTYIFSLVVNDGVQNSTNTATVTITVNTRPVANAGSNQAVAPSAKVTLDGSASSDADAGTTLTYAWSQTSGTTVTLSSSTAAKPTFTAPSAVGALVFSLTVNDGLHSSASTSTTTVTVNNAPTANAGSAQTVTTAGAITLDGSASSDLDASTTLTYKWNITSQPAGSNISLSSTTVQKPTFTPTCNGDYKFSLLVNDGKQDSVAASSVTITFSGGSTCTSTVTWTLRPGWNLVPYTVNAGYADSSALITAIQTGTSFTVANFFGMSLGGLVQHSAFGTVTLVPGNGYLMQLTKSGSTAESFAISGTAYTSISIPAGWSFIGLKSNSTLA